jgi:peptidoglycan hydrolase CwlO-like protein
LDETRAKKNTIQGDVTALDAQIKKAQAEINQRNITITGLAGEINQKTARIATLEERLGRGLESMAKMIREKNEAETTSLAVLALSSGSLSDFLSDVDAIDTVNKNLQDLFDELRGVKVQTEKEKQALNEQKDKQLDAKHEVEVKKQVITQNQTEKKELLDIAKTEEKTYSQVLAERKKRADDIRSALFDLRDAQGISFETALSYATFAQEKTGVRAALILAILSQESDLGKNIGSCMVVDLASGDGKGKNSGDVYQKVMKAPRDTVPFEQITTALGLNWASTPVSCPLGKTYTSSRGYGGAMGPSQFIPSTWKMFEPRLAVALGVGQPNPWYAKDAVMATALYMADLGAAGGAYTAERNAACKYYSGRACDSRSPVNYTYGNSVVAKATTFQQNIDFLNNL